MALTRLQVSLLIMLMLVISCPAMARTNVFNVQSYGAIPDGRTDATKPFKKTWEAACKGSRKPATIVVPSGQYLLSPIIFSGPCAGGLPITMLIKGTLLAPSTYIEDDKWIEFKYVQRLAVHGGTFDGRGESLWRCKTEKHSECPYGAASLSITKSSSVQLHGLRLINSERFHLGIHNSNFVTIDGINISAPMSSPNTDGIHIEYSSYVRIYSGNVATGDDCISLSHKSKHIEMHSITCGPGHGVSIGSLGEDPHLDEEVYNITGRDMIFKGTTNGLRIKTWATRSKGTIKLVSFKNVTMIDVKHPIIVQQDYCDRQADERKCQNKTSSKIAISQMSFVDVRGSSTRKVAIMFNCSKSKPCRDITLRDINLTYDDGKSKVPKETKAECINVSGKSSGVMHPPSCF